MSLRNVILVFSVFFFACGGSAAPGEPVESQDAPIAAVSSADSGPQVTSVTPFEDVWVGDAVAIAGSGLGTGSPGNTSVVFRDRYTGIDHPVTAPFSCNQVSCLVKVPLVISLCDVIVTVNGVSSPVVGGPYGLLGGDEVEITYPVTFGISPPSGPLSGGPVTITGRGFDPTSRVFFGALEAKSPVCTATTCIVNAPPVTQAQTVRVQVETAGVLSDYVPGIHEYYAYGTITMSLAFDTTELSWGDTATGTITLNVWAPANGITVALHADAGGITMPASVVVHEGTNFVTFSVTDTHNARTGLSTTVTATAPGMSASEALYLYPYFRVPPPPPCHPYVCM